MKKVFGFLCLVSALVLLNGCSTPDVDQSYRFGADTADGIVQGSVTYTGSFSRYGVSFHQLPDGVTGRFDTGKSAVAPLPFPSKMDFDEKRLKGTVFAVKLPPGEYEIDRWSVSGGASNVESTVPFSIRFVVEKGKVVYIGNFHFIQVARLGPMVTGATLTYRHEAERDTSMLKAKFPNLAAHPITYSTEPGTNQRNVGGASAVGFTVSPILGRR